MQKVISKDQKLTRQQFILISFAALLGLSNVDGVAKVLLSSNKVSQGYGSRPYGK